MTLWYLNRITLHYTLINFIVMPATFKLLLASLGGKVTKSLNHREGKDLLSVALPLLFGF